jgi:transcriptional regulator with XRE-family HTH domain
MDSLSSRLRSLRKRCHKTLEQVSSEAGISLSFLSDLERGRTQPSLETLEAIAEVYGLTVGEALVNVRIRDGEPD